MTAETDALRMVPVSLIADTMNWMARAYERIHSLPRISDTDLAEKVGAAKERLRPYLAASPAVQPAAGREEALRKAAQRMADDYQVSSNHHPHHVLVQRKDFDDLCQALAAISTPAQASESGSALDPVLFDHAWKMVQAIRGGGTPPFLTPTEAADKAATYLLSRLDERNALSAPQAAPGD